MRKTAILGFVFLMLSTILFGETTGTFTAVSNEDIRVDIELYNYSITSRILKLTFYNNTDSVIKIIWDESLFTDNNGELSRLMKEGQKFIKSDEPQLPTVLPGKEKISLLAVPVSHIEYLSSLGWYVKSISGQPTERKIMICYELNNQKKYLQGKIAIPETSKSGNSSKLDVITLSLLSPVTNEQKEITGYNGYSILLLGYVSRNYFAPLKANSWNTFWQWGTLALIVPYIGIGTEYVNQDNSFSFSVYTLYIVPIVGLSISF